ncbi:MAG: DUF4350 domain-containing protein, partial [Planctomycetota bacterium]
LAAAVAAAWPRGERAGRRILALAAAVAVALAMAAPRLPAANVLAAAVILAALAIGRPRADRQMLLLAAAAVSAFALYRHANTSIPFLWLAADAAAGWLGHLAGTITGLPLWVGSTFAGLDFLVLTGALYAGWLIMFRPGPARAALVLAAILAGHLFYLCALTLAPGLLYALPVHAGAKAAEPPPAVWSQAGPILCGVVLCAFLAGWYVAWFMRARPGRTRMAVVLGVLVLIQAACFCLLVFARDIVAALPAPPDPAKRVWPPRSVWSLTVAVRTLIPWNMQLIACAVHVAVAALMLRSPARPARAGGRPAWLGPVLTGGAVLLALLIPVLGTLTLGKSDLAGKTVVVYKEGFLNWLKPKHDDYGRLAIGMYGALPAHVESLGGRCLISPELSQADLDGADVLVLLFPDDVWEEDQLERIEGFVRGGKTLLVFGEHTSVVTKEPKDKEKKPVASIRDVVQWTGMPAWMRTWTEYSAFNELLQPTGMRVIFDSATFEVGGWLQSYEALSHPATTGMPDDYNEFGVVIGASMRARWPAKPILVGRWGWGDPGDPTKGRSMMGNHKYDPGERLGDILVAAEQRIGKGRVIAFGDTSGMTNGISVGAYKFTSRLLGYAASAPSGPQETWRGVLGLFAALALAALLGSSPTWRRVAASAAVFAATLAVCTSASYNAATILPDGRGKIFRDAKEYFSDGKGTTPRDKAQAPVTRPGQLPINNLAYIDNSHLEPFSSESWRMDGTMGVTLTLMRNGYIVRDLSDFSAERLKRAGLVLSIAPGREFTRAEREAVREFVEGGGIFIITVGYDDVEPSRRLLADFGLMVGLEFPYTGEHVLGVNPQGEQASGHTHVHTHADTEANTKAAPNAATSPAARRSVLKKSIVEPEPQGHFKSPYYRISTSPTSSYMVFVRFDSGWAVNYVRIECTKQACGLKDARVIANTLRRVPETGKHVNLPVILVREAGKGKVVLVGDTGFAMNKNLEVESGWAFEGMRENPHFWRWFLADLRGQEQWLPPEPKPKAAADDHNHDEEDAE